MREENIVWISNIAHQIDMQKEYLWGNIDTNFIKHLKQIRQKPTYSMNHIKGIL